MNDLPCGSCCEHGGVCVLLRGHQGDHDSRYCRWTDAEALPKDDADQIFMREMARGGDARTARSIIELTDMLVGLLEKMSNPREEPR